MKLFKKLAAFILSLSMCVSVVACNQPTGNESGSGGNDSTPPASSDTGSQGGNQDSEQDSEQGGEQGGETESEGAKYIAAIEQQLKSANTITMTVTSSTVDEMTDSADSENNQYSAVTSVSEVTLAKTDTGYNAFVETTSEYVFQKDGEKQTETTFFYLVDGMSYTYSEELECYICEPTDTDLSALIGMFTAEEIAQMEAMLAETFDQTVTVTNSQAKFAYDGKDAANGLLDYIGAINPEEDTLGGILNDALALIAEDLTAESILAKIEALDTVTVGEAVDAIDAWLQENNDGLTLQQFKDELLADERIVGLLTSSGLSADEIAAVKAASIATEIEPYKDMLLDECVYHLGNSLTGMTGDGVPTYEETIAGFAEQNEGLEEPLYDTVITYLTYQAKATLPLTINELAGEEGAAQVAGIIESIKVAEVTELSSEFIVTFGNLYNIAKIEYTFEMGYTNVTDTRSAMGSQQASFILDTISTQTTTIALPADIKTCFAFWSLADEIDSNVKMYRPDNEQLAAGVADGSLYDDELDRNITFEYKIPTEYTTEVEVTITYIGLCGGCIQYYDEELSALLNGDLTYTLSMEDGALIGFAWPEVNTADVVITVVDESGNPLQDYIVWFYVSESRSTGRSTDGNGMVYLTINADIENWTAQVALNGSFVTSKVGLAEFIYDADGDVYTYTFVVNTAEEKV